MKQENKEALLETLFDLAEENGVTPEEFLENLADKPLPDGLPDEVIAELTAGRDQKKQSRRDKRIADSREQTDKEIAAFCEIFPDVNPESIPDSVWIEVGNGIPLAYAYALYKVTEGKTDGYAEKVNQENLHKSAALSDDGETEPSYTKEQVEKMSDKDVKKNFKNILRSSKKWHI